MLTREFQERFITVLGEITEHYSVNTIVKTLNLLGHEDGIIALEKIMDKELPEKDFLKELKVIKKS